MTNKQIISEIRKGAKEYGLLFKQANVTLNGSYLWQLKDRKTGELLMDNYRLTSAWSDYCNGYMSTYNKETGYFEGVR